jgi:DNA-binding NtrC family response regulator
MASILMYGRNPSLLEIRARVLRSASYRVKTASCLEDIPQILSEEQIDMVILCHTVSPEDCDRVLALTALSPQTDSLVLTSGSRGCHSQFGFAFDTTDGPAKLVSTIGKLVETASKSHTHFY